MNTIKEKVSIVIPIYNVEKYLEKCVESVVNQTYNKLEIILVNDGSNDSSGILAENLAKLDKRIKVFTKKNGGVSSARNFGLEKSTGKYIMFIDPDDYIELNMIENMIYLAEENGSDMVICGYYFENHYKTIKSNINIDQFAVNYIEAEYRNIIEMKKNMVDIWDTSLMYNVWNKIYRKDLIIENNIKFSDKKMGEDLEFNINYLNICTSMYITSKCFYHYIREREGAATQNYVKNWFEIRLKENDNLKKFFAYYGIMDENGREYLSRRFVERTLGCIENEFNYKNIKSKTEKMNEIKKIINNRELQEALKYMKPKSKKISVLIIPLKIKSKLLTYLMGYNISLIRRYIGPVFLKLKQSR